MAIATMGFMFSSFDCPDGPVPTCPLHDDGFTVFFPHPNDCHFFFQCIGGVAYCKKCPAGLQWNTILDACDYPYNVICGENRGLLMGNEAGTIFCCCPGNNDCRSPRCSFC